MPARTIATFTPAERSLIAAAAACSRRLHDASGETRRYTGEPFAAHPTRVAAIVTESLSGKATPGDARLIAAAHLHDVIDHALMIPGKSTDDVESALRALSARFGDDVMDLVTEVSLVARPSARSGRASRRARNLAHLAKASPRAQTIYLAGIIDNLESIVQHDPRFAATWLPDKLDVLAVMRDGDSALWARAFRGIRHGLTRISAYLPPDKAHALTRKIATLATRRID